MAPTPRPPAPLGLPPASPPAPSPPDARWARQRDGAPSRTARRFLRPFSAALFLFSCEKPDVSLKETNSRCLSSTPLTSWGGPARLPAARGRNSWHFTSPCSRRGPGGEKCDRCVPHALGMRRPPQKAATGEVTPHPSPGLAAPAPEHAVGQRSAPSRRSVRPGSGTGRTPHPRRGPSPLPSLGQDGAPEVRRRPRERGGSPRRAGVSAAASPRRGPSAPLARICPPAARRARAKRPRNTDLTSFTRPELRAVSLKPQKLIKALKAPN